jgi:phosphate transport system permease protein
MVGTVTLVLLASLLAIPLGVAAGIYVSEYAPPRFRRFFDLGIDMLAGVPSIVMGLFGFALILLLRRTLAPDARTGLWLSAFCIALLVVPYLVRTTQSSLQALPEGVRLLGPGLGLTRWQSLRWILLPGSSPGILGGVMLAIGRAAEDTAVIMLTGAVYNAGLPSGLAEKYEALPFRIFVTAAEYRSDHELAQGFGCALVLLLLTAALLGLSARLQRGMEKRWRR